MTTAIRIAILGYGNLGRGVELAVTQQSDMRLAGIFTRRDPASLKTQTPNAAVFPAVEIATHRRDVDVLILCGGSKDDIPSQGPKLAAQFNTVDSYDTHARIPEHYARMDAAARQGGKLALISCGWDPGLFSVNRMMADALLPDGATYTFWGRGVSQGHGDAIRSVPGVADAVQYTVPITRAMEEARSGARPELSTRQKHRRECYVVLEAGADPEQVRQAIVSMPYYFDEYDTTVEFVSADQLSGDHSRMPHGGFVIRSGNTGADHHQMIEYQLKLDSNPEFTGSVLVACARAVYHLHQKGEAGARTLLDVPPALLSPKPAEELRRKFL